MSCDSPLPGEEPEKGGDTNPEYRPAGPDAGIRAARALAAETRSRAEYYQALRAAEGTTSHAAEGQDATADARTEASGWDTVDAVSRPPLDAIQVSPERARHILDGDPFGGGHRHGTGKPGKTEFPAHWDDKKIIDALLDVARRPDQPPGRQDWNDRWVARGTRDDVEVVVVVARDGRIWSGWPKPVALA